MARRNFNRPAAPAGNMIDMKTGKAPAKSDIPIICERIRHYRELLGIEQKELARLVDVTGNAVSNWENGRSRPDINLIPPLCDALHASLYELFGMDAPSSSFTTDEQLHIDNYRQLTRGHRFAVDRLTDALLTVQQSEAGPQLRRLPFFEKSLAAGIGDPTEFEAGAAPLFVYAEQISSRADCVFSVSGDSMEPAYHDGDRVLVERIPDAPELSEGETGAFIIGNETYIKNYAADGLHSLNPHYPVMRFQDEDAVYLIGRVLGVLDPSAVASDADAERYMMTHDAG